MAKIEGSSGLGDFIFTVVGNKPVEGAKEVAAASATPGSEGNEGANVANGVKEGV